MLTATASTFATVFEHLTVVMRPEDAELAAHLAGIGVTYAEQAHLGMGQSLSAGIRALHPVDFVFVGLADMPFLKIDTLRELVGVMEPLDDDAIVQPVYRSTPGHPVGFGRAHFDALSKLTGDVGAKAVVAAERTYLRQVIVDDPGVIRDVDVPPQEK